MTRGFIVTCFTCLSAALVGCAGEDLGACNEDQLVSGEIGDLQSRCNSCHSAGSVGAGRKGAPAGLDFDTPDSRANYRDLMWEEVKADRMPPPAPAGSGSFSGEEKEAFRNWLACESRGIEAPSCTGAEWTCLWEELAVDCVGCHAEATKSVGGGIVLGEANDACGARENLLGQAPLAGGMCDGAANLVVAGDAAGSLLYQKLIGTDASGAAVCGDVMPWLQTPFLERGDAAKEALVTRLQAWIDGGALAPECN